MNCFSELTYSMFADGELAAEERRRVEAHLAECDRCRALVHAMRAENEVLAAALALPVEAPPATASVRGMLREFLGVVVVLAVVGAGLQWVAGALPANLDWLNPLTTDGRMNLFFSVVFYLRQAGPAMLGDLTVAITWIILLLVVIGAVRLLWRRPAALRSRMSLVAVILVAALPGWGLTKRTGQSVTVAQNETIDDTLFASGDVVDIDGTVNGDLITGGREVNIRGTVKGNLFAWSQHVEITGTVEGSVFGFAQLLELRGPGRIGHTLYGWDQFLRLQAGSRVEQDVMQGSQHAEINGAIGRNLMSFSGEVDIRGDIGRNVSIRTGGVTLSAPAKVGGDFNAYVRHAADVRMGSGVVIAGKSNTHITVRRSRYTRPMFYFWEAVLLLAAFIIGWLLTVFVPRFFYDASQRILAWGRSLGLGAAILILTPVAVIICCVTLVGIPLGVITFLLYLIALYMAKIFVGAFLGRALLGQREAGQRHNLMALFLGLLLLTIATHIPFVGGIIAVAMLCFGLGALGWQLYREVHAGRAAA